MAYKGGRTTAGEDDASNKYRALPIEPKRLTPAQEPYYRQSKQQIETQFSAASQSQAMASNGALLGPWSVWIQAPAIGSAFASLQAGISELKALSPRAEQVVILLTAARQRADYELAGHRTVALALGFSAGEADALIAGYPPITLARDEQLAAAAALCLLVGGPLVEHLYVELQQTFGPYGPLHLCCIVGQYLFLSVTLNTFDVPVPSK